MRQLRPYQQQAIDRVRNLWRQGKRSTVLVAPTGAGKTAVAEEFIRLTLASGRARVYFLAHATELVAQPLDRLRRSGFRVGAIKAGMPPDPDASVQVASTATIVRREISAMPEGTALVMVDECFPAGTVIDGRRIEDIQVGDFVQSFDDNGFISRNRVLHTFKNRRKNLLKIHLRSGKSLTCTPNHRIMSCGGFRHAVHLQIGDEIYGKRNGIFLLHMQENVCYRQEARDHQIQDLQETILLKGLQFRVHIEDIKSYHDCDQCQVQTPHHQKDEGKQPNGQPIHSGSDEENPYRHGTLAAYQRREWERSDPSASPIAAETWGRLADGSGDTNEDEEGFRVSNLLQVGSCLPGPETWCGSGWSIPFLSHEEGARCKEGCILAIDRVDSVEVLECGDPSHNNEMRVEDYVYNLEVEKDSTYFANGVAVHNCHHVRSSTHMAVLDSLRRSHKTVFTILLTATPYRLDQRGLGDIADSLVELVTPSQLIDAGYLLDPVCYDAPRDTESDSDATRPKLIGDIVETWRKHSLNLPTICRAVNIAHSIAIAQRFRDAGIPSAHISGDMGDDERALLFARLAIGPTQSDGIAVLTTGGTMLEEGFDSAESYRHAKRLYPNCAYDPLVTLIDAAPTSSRGAWIQRLGRITRPYSAAQASADGVMIVRPKTRAIALVHTANLLEHGFLRDHHGFSLTTGDGGGKSGPSAPTPITCKACLAMSPRSATACVGCGASIAPGEPDVPREKAGELQQRAWSPPLAGAAEDRQLSYLKRKMAEVKKINCERMLLGMPPYKAGWVGAQFKMMFGDWPSKDLMRRAESL